MGVETNKRSGSSKENSGIIRENSRRPNEIPESDEENSISSEEAIRDSKEPKEKVDA
jgi:hypothetical protein